MGYEETEFETDSVFLVTGGAGFIGSSLCEILLVLDNEVRNLEDLSNGHQANVDLFIDHPNYTFIKGGVCDLETCLKTTQGVDMSYIKPLGEICR